MFKRFTMAFAALALLGGAAVADDLLDEIGGLDLGQVNDVVSEVEDFDLAAVDVEGLAGDADQEDGTDAIEACFRRIGYCRPSYCNYGWSYPSCYSYYGNYHSYYPSSYSYCYRPISYTYTNYCQPIYSYYWGCY